jgi:vacuolar-type H+-ATPase subunit E/Vma4
MDPLANSDGLFSAIGRQAEQERAAVMAEAEARAREISARADAEAEREKAEAFRRLEREMIGEGQRLLGEARMEARNERLEMKRRLITRAFEAARTELGRLAATPGYRDGLAALAAQAAEAAGEGGSVQTVEAEGSVVAVSKDGRRRVDNGLLSRLARAETRVESEVARILFGGPAGAGGGAPASGQGGGGKPG